MTSLQRFAWFNLIVIAITITTILLLLPFMGKGALGGFGFLGLLGFMPFFFRRRNSGRKVLVDERDRSIFQRASVLAYSVFWAAFVLAASLLSAWVYGAEGAVPVWIVQMSVFCGLMLVFALTSVAILLQYPGGAGNAE